MLGFAIGTSALVAGLCIARVVLRHSRRRTTPIAVTRASTDDPQPVLPTAALESVRR